MSMSGAAYVDRRAALASRAADYVELTKPRIAALVLVTVASASCVAAWGLPDPLRLIHTLLGTALVAASASALNQWLEIRIDARMPRTENRPLPAGRLVGSQAVWFAAATVALGIVYLTLAVNGATALLGLLTWGLYVWVYTPLKKLTTANTAVGAVAGAMPVLMGWTAQGGSLDLPAFTLFLIVFLWQFPHFMAIAWLYRGDYAAAGLKMLTVVDPSGTRAGAQAAVSALALAPVSLLPAVLGIAGGAYFAWALALNAVQFGSAVLFLVRRDDESARLLLRVSLTYLSALMIMLLLGPWA